MILKQNESIDYFADSCNFDVLVKCFDREILTHKMILGAASSWFKDMLIKSETEEMVQTILMKDYLSTDILTFLDFVHGKFDILDKGDVMNVLSIDVMPTNQFETVQVDVKDDCKIEVMDICDPLCEKDTMDMLNEVIKEEGNIKTEFYDEVIDQEEVDGSLEKQKTDKNKGNVDKEKIFKLAPKLLDIECKKCCIFFNEEYSFVKHCKEVHDNHFSCHLCEFVHKRFSKLIDHRGRVHGIGDDIKCEVCDYSTKVKGDMNLHIKRMHSGIFYKCDKCDYKAREKNLLKQHIAFKHDNIVYHCDQCTFTAALERTVLKHKLRVHEGLAQKWPCNQCDIVLSSKVALKSHIASQHSEKEFLCDKCEYKTGTKENLNHHVKHHHEDFMYQCKKCDFKCKAKTNLYNHNTKVHKGVTYPCVECDYLAPSAGRLKEHRVRKHGLDSKFKCDICGHRSSIKCYLLQHIREKHEGLRRRKPKKTQQEQKEEPNSDESS